jgi:hypothetical protein
MPVGQASVLLLPMLIKFSLVRFYSQALQYSYHVSLLSSPDQRTRCTAAKELANEDRRPQAPSRL